MPDGRMLSKTIAHNEQLAEVSLEADYLFARCLPHLDREGRMAGNAKLVKSIACPLRPQITIEGIPDLLRELGSAKLVRWYSVEGREVLEFPGFKNHQKGFRFDREAESRFPEHTCRGAIDLLRTNSGPTPDKVRTSEVEVEVEGKVEVEVEVKGATADDIWRLHRATCVDFVKSNGYGPTERLIAEGESSAVWRGTRTGDPVPWEDRLRILTIADGIVEAKQRPNLRSALVLAIQQEYDPLPIHKADTPKPATEAAAVRTEYPKQNHTASTRGLALVGAGEPDEKPADDLETLRVKKWEADNPEPAARLRIGIASRVPREFANIANLAKGWVENEFRKAVLEKLREASAA